MKQRTFTVPFATALADATELDFGPDDFILVRPIFGLPRDEATALIERMQSVVSQGIDAAALEDENPAKDAAVKDAEKASDSLIIDTFAKLILTWSLTGADGNAIERPKTPKALNALPGAMVKPLYEWLLDYRGEGPNPTTRS